MFTLKNLKKINRFRLIALTATLLLIGGFSTLLYTISVIQGYTQVLDSSQLTTKEMWSYEGSLQWWQSMYTTTILPLTAVMITIGFVTLLGPTILTKIQQRHVIKAFTNELELASTEKFEIE
jgi:flagellar biosynthesis protein FlhB